jgi:hypothetical protein
LSALEFRHRPDNKNSPTPPYAQARTARTNAGVTEEVVMSTTWEQLEGAALSLARSGSIKDRLADAFRNHLAQVNTEELPDPLRAQYRACQEALTRERPQPGEDAVRATVRKMSNSEADEVAAGVVRLYGAFAREWTREPAPLPNLVMNGVALNGGTTARPKKGVPQVISLYAHEA